MLPDSEGDGRSHSGRREEVGEMNPPPILKDRLSELPETLIQKILSCLSMNEVTATLIFSKQWKDIWTTMPCIHFRFEKKRYETSPAKFTQFVSRVISRYVGKKLVRFSLNLRQYTFDFENLDRWLKFAVDKKVEDLHIELDWRNYYLPDCVYSCESLKSLTLFCIDLDRAMNLRWNVLTDLTIVDTSITEHAMHHILLGAPQLEVLNLHIWDLGNNLVIRSPKLKVLSVGYRFMSRDDMVTPTSTTISADSLEILELAQLWHTWCTLEVPSFTVATVGFRHDYDRLMDPRWTKDIQKMTRQTLMGVSHVEELVLNEWSVMLLIHQMEKDSSVQFLNVKHLTLHIVEAVGMRSVLVLFPVLETLMVEHMQVGQYNRLESETTFPIPSLLHLKTVDITWRMRDYDSILPDVETLLENAHELEKLVLQLTIYEAGYDRLPFKISKKVLEMRKSSEQMTNKFFLQFHVKDNMVVQFSKVTAEAEGGTTSG